MIRVVYFLIVVGVLALGAAWLADRPGDVIVTWQGLRFKTSLMVMAAAWVEKAQARDAAIAASRKLAADALAALSKPNPQ